MKDLNIKLTGERYLDNAVIKIDGKPATFKKNEFKNYTVNYKTENDKVKIEVYKMLDVGGIGWFITQLLFFIISIFGIFDVRYKFRHISLEYSAEFDLKEGQNNITIRIAPPKENTKSVITETDLQFNENINKYSVNAKAKKTLKILKFAKILLTLAIIAVVILILFI